MLKKPSLSLVTFNPEKSHIVVSIPEDIKTLSPYNASQYVPIFSADCCQTANGRIHFYSNFFPETIQEATYILVSSIIKPLEYLEKEVFPENSLQQLQGWEASIFTPDIAINIYEVDYDEFKRKLHLLMKKINQQ